MATKRTTKTRRDVEQEVTDRVMAALERGTVPWAKPWNGGGMLPTSVSTGRPYRGINVMLLSMTAMERGYASPYWMTFNQAAELGGTIRKGEKATQVVFWKSYEVKDKETDETKRVFILRHFSVFNFEQTEDVVLPKRFQIEDDAVAPDPIEAAEAIWAAYVNGPSLVEAPQDSAFYDRSADRITLPMPEQFPTAERRYGTLFHEAVHSTGHESRLDRFDRNGEPQHFGTARYAREELCAELGAAMLRAHSGIADDGAVEQSAAYIANWLQALRADKSLLVKAASQAQKAVDRVLGTVFEKEEAA